MMIKKVIATMTTIIIVVIMVIYVATMETGYFANLQRCYSSSICCSACGHFLSYQVNDLAVQVLYLLIMALPALSIEFIIFAVILR